MHSPQTPPAEDRAFSLVELLVAFAVIAVIAVVLMPLLSKVSEKASLAKCQNQLRQLANAGLLYAAERNGALPDRGNWNSVVAVSDSLFPYLNIPLKATGTPADTVLTCPSIQKSEFKTTANLWHQTYSINQYATGSDNSVAHDSWVNQVRGRGVPLRLGNVSSAARQAFFMDGTAVWEGGNCRYSNFQAPDRLTARTEPPQEGWRTPFIHGDFIQVVFLDGHLEAISRARAEAELIGPTNPSVSQAYLSPRTHPFWGTTQ